MKTAKLWKLDVSSSTASASFYLPFTPICPSSSWHSSFTPQKNILISSAKLSFINLDWTPLPPPYLPLSLWWVKTPNKWKRGQGLYPVTEWIWHMMIGGPKPPMNEGEGHLSPSSVLLNMRMALEILRAGPSFMLMIFTMSVWVSSRKASPSIIWSAKVSKVINTCPKHRRVSTAKNK